MDFLGDSQGATGYIVNQDLVDLNNAWCTETNAQEILPYKANIVDVLQEKLTVQQVQNFSNSHPYFFENKINVYSVYFCRKQ